MTGKSGQDRPTLDSVMIPVEQMASEWGQILASVRTRDPAVDVQVNFDAGGRPFQMSVTTLEAELPITAMLIRSLPIQGIIDAARDALIDYVTSGRGQGAADPMWAERLRQRPGRSGRPDSDYARIAQVYADLIEEGLARPVERLAERFNVSRSTARNWMSEARARGIIERPTARQPGGELTEYGRGLLAEDSQRLTALPLDVGDTIKVDLA